MNSMMELLQTLNTHFFFVVNRAKNRSDCRDCRTQLLLADLTWKKSLRESTNFAIKCMKQVFFLQSKQYGYKHGETF